MWMHKMMLTLKYFSEKDQKAEIHRLIALIIGTNILLWAALTFFPIEF